jgi:hypothetical protein
MPQPARRATAVADKVSAPVLPKKLRRESEAGSGMTIIDSEFSLFMSLSLGMISNTDISC